MKLCLMERGRKAKRLSVRMPNDYAPEISNVLSPTENVAHHRARTKSEVQLLRIGCGNMLLQAEPTGDPAACFKHYASLGCTGVNNKSK